MAKTYLTIDTRAKDSLVSVKLMISHKRKVAAYPLDIRIEPHQWDANRERVINHPNAPILNSNILLARSDVERKLLLIEPSDIENLTATQLRDMLAHGQTKPTQVTFISHLQKVASKRSQGTQKIYKETISRIAAFDKKYEKLTFADITKDWLERFNAFMALTSSSQNYRNIHLRNIRTIFNDAIDNGITTLYPFRTLRIRPTKTAKRSITTERMREYMTAPCEPHIEYYRDLFLLSFYLIGINTVDLFNLVDIVDGRIEYKRAKTKKLYSIKVEPEALQIINKYRGKKKLLDMADRYTNYQNFSHRLNDNLKLVGAEFERVGLGGKKEYASKPFNYISTYWARHTWASIASYIDIPNDTIAAALGHEMGNPTTAIYIDFNQEKVDEANRKVIDYVLYDKR